MIPGCGIGVRKKILATPCVGKHMYAVISVQSGLAAKKPNCAYVSLFSSKAAEPRLLFVIQISLPP